jgi:hypothetical protein
MKKNSFKVDRKYLILAVVLIAAAAAIRYLARDEPTVAEKHQAIENKIAKINRLKPGSVTVKEGVIRIPEDAAPPLKLSAIPNILTGDATVLKLVAPAFDLRELCKAENCYFLDLAKVGTRNYDLSGLADFPHLEVLALRNFTAGEIRTLPALAKLSYLGFLFEQPAALETGILGKMKHLESLKLENVSELIAPAAGTAAMPAKLQLNIAARLPENLFIVLKECKIESLGFQEMEIDLKNIPPEILASITNIYFDRCRVSHFEELYANPEAIVTISESTLLNADGKGKFIREIGISVDEAKRIIAKVAAK